MKRQGKRFIALFVVIMTIMSFLPVGYSGQVAEAAVSNGTELEVKVIGDSQPISPIRDDTYRENVYSTRTVVDGFDMTVQDIRQTIEELKTEALANRRNVTGYTEQTVNIQKINSMDVANVTTNMGVTIEDAQNAPGAVPRVGKRIKNLPLGVNLIQYNLKFTQITITYVPATETTPERVVEGNPITTEYDSQTVTIEHATRYVVNKINPMRINSFIGNAGDIDSSSTLQNNTIPFLYSRVATPDSRMALRYIIDVPDSYTSLNYQMTFDSTLVLDNAKVYKKGQLDTGVSTSGNTLSGNLLELGDRDIIVVKLDASAGNSAIQKAYSVELRYTNLDSDKDYSLREAGITKLDYNNDPTVKAYIGKKFDVSTTTDGVPRYEGQIYIDQKARMISIEPNLYRNRDTVAYEINNDYVSNGTSGNKVSEFKNGKQYINFMYGTTSNTININVFEGENGNRTGAHLATYVLHVNLLETDNFHFDLDFANTSTSSGEVFLTQRGVKENRVDFTLGRRVYDLYCGNSVQVKLSGQRSSRKEYIRVWLSDSEGSGNFVEAEASRDNDPVNMVRNETLNINLGNAKKMKIQAYYDDFDASNHFEGSHAIGNAYEFYLANNISGANNQPGDDSRDAALSSLKIKEGQLEDADGTKGFRSDTYKYTVTVPRETTSVKMTAIPADENVRSIIGTIKENSAVYDFESGVQTEVDLSPTGKTTLNIVVTAQDRTTKTTYTVVIINDTKGSVATLDNLIVNPGEYEFDASEERTRVRVNEETRTVQITPVPTDPKAKVTVDGQRFKGSPVIISVKGSKSTEIEIEVKSEDGVKTETYKVIIVRGPANSNDEPDQKDDGDVYYDEERDIWINKNKYEEWGSVKGKAVYFDRHGRQVKDAWISEGSNWYYVNDRGFRATGWKMQTDGNYYYLDTKTGAMRTGWIYVGNIWYYMGTTGIMKTGWLEQNGKWYYLNPSGQMVCNQSMYIDGKVYNFAQDGTMY